MERRWNGGRTEVLWGYQREALENVAIPLTHHALIQVAAQAELRHNDDTPMRGQSLRREMVASHRFLPPLSESQISENSQLTD